MSKFDWITSRWHRTQKGRGAGGTSSLQQLIVTATIVASPLSLLAQATSAKIPPPTFLDLTKQSRPPRNPRGPGIPGGGQLRPSPPRNPRGPGIPGGGNLYDDILNQLRQENRLGVRGGNLCVVSPPARLTDTTNEIWHDRPLFIWQGAAVRIELLASGSEEVLWSKNLTPEDRIALYNGEPLEPGRRYQWRLYLSEQDSVGNSFKILPTEELARISTELTQLENQLQARNATEEEIALERANFFAKRRLWSDALQVIFTTQNPSEQLKNLAQEITAYICNSSGQNPNQP